MAALKEQNIGTGIHYPVPLHLQKAYSSLKYQSETFRQSEQAASQVVSLPMFPTLTPEQQNKVVEGIRNFTVSSTSLALSSVG